MINTHLNCIDALSDQISALLDLISCSDELVDHQSITTACEMCATMHEELMIEIDAIQKKEWKKEAKDE